MKLQTQIPLQSEPYNQIDYHSKIVLLGSCFAENIGEKFNYYKFQHLQNPFGILFHPLAIEQLITNAINENEYQEQDIFFHNEQWHCFDAHSKLSDASKGSFLNTLNNQILLTSSFIKSCSHVIITLGTAWVYRHIESDSLVANCHKVPQKQFEKELLTVDQITESLEAIRVMLKSVNPKVSIIFTVSPVRHLKDGFIANSQSKAHLISAIHNVVEPRNQSYYFPSYEIMLDELRDYRFYKDDMIHPNNLAIEYIWKKFQDVWISKEANSTLKEIEAIQKGLDHKPFNPNSESYQEFLEELKTKQQKVQEVYSHIIF
ncbi:GSCFA domain-containing protein [Hanstruepera neustonica]|uniref:GSCFA domain-containing protein n=1 Tax=Hanstruepera neustonica TaxID=1445657 RepID=A0A2K1E0Q2_9FLAO|nr:GSCFA domain-containing protein [Hanstruepera neustonica]PNQ73849.1 GSCFA domain-containing protein [Hanstruepera neustonica]